MTDFIFASAETCIGCRTCEVACAQAHLPENAGVSDHFYPRLRVNRVGDVTVPVMCHQCENAPCAASCPVSALKMGEHSVEADAALCIGCRNCMVACPFGAIAIEAVASSQQMDIVKCDLCSHREQGPACVAACPTNALKRLSSQEIERQKQLRRENRASSWLSSGF